MLPDLLKLLRYNIRIYVHIAVSKFPFYGHFASCVNHIAFFWDHIFLTTWVACKYNSNKYLVFS